MPVAVLSDCNSLFITHILTGARVNACVRHLITNPASFHRVLAPPSADAATDVSAAAGDSAAMAQQAAGQSPAAVKPASTSFAANWFGFRSTSNSTSTAASATRTASRTPSKPPMATNHRLVIEPRHDTAACGTHGCTLCPTNLCKGCELAALRAATPARRVVYCGDGANDLCPALALGPGDVVLCRSGHRLEALIAERAAAAEAEAATDAASPGDVSASGGGVRAVQATVVAWRSHEELYRLVQQYAL